MMNGISRNKRRSPHACRSAVGIFICASNGIGPAQYEVSLRRIYAVSPYLTIWAEVPAWMIWLFWHRIWKTGHKSSHGKEPEQ